MILKKQITDVEKWATSNAKIVAEYNKLPKQTENLLETAYCDAYSQIVSLSEKTEGLTFSEALEALKEGKQVAHKNWGKGFIYLVEQRKNVTNDVGLSKATFSYYKQDISDNSSEKITNKYVLYVSYICMKADDGTIINGWLPSLTDMLFDDWLILI